MADCSNSEKDCQQRTGIVYKITNLEDGKVYVGQTVQKLNERLYQHVQCKKTAIGCAINKYGWENFKAEIIEECPREMLNERERFWIKFYDCMAPKGYNLTNGGDTNFTVSDETRAKISMANTGENNPFYGKHHTPETRAKISQTNKAQGIKPPSRKGTILSEEHKAKISASGKGRECSAETRAKISAANKGRKLSEAHKAKLSAAKKGRKLSDKKDADIAISLFEDDNN